MPRNTRVVVKRLPQKVGGLIARLTGNAPIQIPVQQDSIIEKVDIGPSTVAQPSSATILQETIMAPVVPETQPVVVNSTEDEEQRRAEELIMLKQMFSKR